MIRAALFVALLFGHAAAAQPADPAALLPPELRARGTLRLATAAINEPHAWLPAGSNQPTGFEIEFGREIARRLGLRPAIEVVGFDTLLTGLRAGRYDVSASALAASEERRQVADFLVTTQTSFVIITRRGNPTGIAGLDSLCGRAVAVLDASRPLVILQEQQARCAANGQPAMQMSILARGGSSIVALQSGRVEANVISRPRGLAVERQTEGRIEVLQGPPISEEQVGFAFPRRSPLLPAFDAALRAMVADGTYRAILERFNAADLALAAP
jgi:polar amino acid transport system substrate-binding protein